MLSCLYSSLMELEVAVDSYARLGEYLPNEGNLEGYSVHAMGGGYIGNDGSTKVQNSSRPEAHAQEASHFDKLVRAYAASERGQQFLDYAEQQGRKFIDIIGRGAADLGDHVVAAVIHDGEKGIIVGNYENKDFLSRVSDFAQLYGLSEDAALEYALDHEFAHVAGYNSEAEAEGLLREYFTGRMQESHGTEREKYAQLAAVAKIREEEAQGKE